MTIVSLMRARRGRRAAGSPRAVHRRARTEARIGASALLSFATFSRITAKAFLMRSAMTTLTGHSYTYVDKNMVIGAGTTILCGATVGGGVVIASGKVVPFDVESAGRVGGMLERPIKLSFASLRNELMQTKTLEEPDSSSEYCVPVAPKREA